MIIPPRCFTCGEIIADKWVPFINTVNEILNIIKINLFMTSSFLYHYVIQKSVWQLENKIQLSILLNKTPT